VKTSRFNEINENRMLQTALCSPHSKHLNHTISFSLSPTMEKQGEDGYLQSEIGLLPKPTMLAFF
jgi:hypothetical protein